MSKTLLRSFASLCSLLMIADSAHLRAVADDGFSDGFTTGGLRGRGLAELAAGGHGSNSATPVAGQAAGPDIRRKLPGPSFTRGHPGYQAGGGGRSGGGWHCNRDCWWLITHGIFLASTPFMFSKRRLDDAEPAADLADFVPGPDSLPRIKQAIHAILTRAQLEKNVASELEQLVNTLEEQRQIATSEHINVDHLLNLEDTKMQVEHQLGAHLSSLGIAGGPFAATDNTHMEDGTSVADSAGADERALAGVTGVFAEGSVQLRKPHTDQATPDQATPVVEVTADDDQDQRY